MTLTEAQQLEEYFARLEETISGGRVYLAVESIQGMRNTLRQFRGEVPVAAFEIESAGLEPRTTDSEV